MGLEHLKNKIAIVGVGYTPQGKVPGRTAVSFHTQAIRNAVLDAGIGKHDIGALLLYRHFEPLGGDYDVTAFSVAEQLGIRPAVLSQEYYCTRGWLFHAAGLLVSGLCDYVVVSYGDNARSARRSFTKELSHGAATDELAAYGDLSTMAKYAMLARRAMDTAGTGPHVWKEIAVAQRRWACLNPAASMYGKPMSEEDYLASPYVTEPLRLLDATPVTDGGRAIVLTTAEKAAALPHPPVYVAGFGSANQPLSPFRLRVGDAHSAARAASGAAFAMAGMGPGDVDACELYDCFTCTVEETLRDYGLLDSRDVCGWLSADRIGPGGELPVNTSGGMLSEAYFMGLTPVSEAVMQLMGRCQDRQLGTLPGTKQPEVIVCSDNGGVFQSHCTLILQRGAR